MNTLIVGYGAMGREIEAILLERGHTIAGRIDPVAPGADSAALSEDTVGSADSAIEFSLPEAVLPNARFYAAHGLKATVGTTGWTEDLPEIESLFASQGGFLHGSNFSIGANIFFDLVQQAAEAIASLPQYDIMMYEIHHSNKKDSPSGTALTTADRILRGHSGKTEVVTARLDRRPEPHELHVASVRGGSVPGVHTVLIDSAEDTIELKHSARGRTGFALGAVLAAEWLDKHDGIFTIGDFIRDVTGKGDTV